MFLLQNHVTDNFRSNVKGADIRIQTNAHNAGALTDSLGHTVKTLHRREMVGTYVSHEIHITDAVSVYLHISFHYPSL